MDAPRPPGMDSGLPPGLMPLPPMQMHMSMMPLPPLSAMPPMMGGPHHHMQAPSEPAVDPSFQAPELLEPNNTVYINNINEKVKEKDLKKALQAVFSEHGKVLQIVAMSSIKRRGQAFVVYESLEAATQAVTKLQGFLLFNKKIRLNYAKELSNVVAKAQGTYVPKPKKPLPPKQPLKRRHSPEFSFDNLDDSEPAAKRAPTYDQAPVYQAPRPIVRPPAKVEDNPPNRILKLNGLPQDAVAADVEALFAPFPGFKEVRMVPGLYDIAFVEYENEMQAIVARTNLQGAAVRNSAIIVNYAKK